MTSFYRPRLPSPPPSHLGHGSDSGKPNADDAVFGEGGQNTEKTRLPGSRGANGGRQCLVDKITLENLQTGRIAKAQEAFRIIWSEALFRRT